MLVINRDSRVDLADFAELSAAWLTETGDENWDESCNLYSDTVIDVRDLEILAENWLKGK